MIESSEQQKEITPVDTIDTDVSAPPSKAHTLRALFVSSLASGESVLKNALHANDQQHAASALCQFGADIRYQNGDYFVRGTGGNLTVPDETVYTGSSGVTTRFMIPYAALAPGRTRIDASEQMRARPVGDLVEALTNAGIPIQMENGGIPLTVEGNDWPNNHITVRVDESSQYASGLLISAPYVPGGLTISLEGELKSGPYLKITKDVMEAFGGSVDRPDDRTFVVSGDTTYEAQEFQVEGDYSSASYFFAAAAVTGGRVRVRNLNPNSRQGDQHVLNLLEQMGCSVQFSGSTVEVQGGTLEGMTVNMGDCPDLVPTLAVVAAFAEGRTRITNVGHLRGKESNRLQSTKENLKACNIEATVTEDAIEIVGGRPEGAVIDPVGDHRIAMSFAVLGLAVPGVKIQDPNVVNKSFPDFFERFSALTNKT